MKQLSTYVEHRVSHTASSEDGSIRRTEACIPVRPALDTLQTEKSATMSGTVSSLDHAETNL